MWRLYGKRALQLRKFTIICSAWKHLTTDIPAFFLHFPQEFSRCSSRIVDSVVISFPSRAIFATRFFTASLSEIVLGETMNCFNSYGRNSLLQIDYYGSRKITCKLLAAFNCLWTHSIHFNVSCQRQCKQQSKSLKKPQEEEAHHAHTLRMPVRRGKSTNSYHNGDDICKQEEMRPSNWWKYCAAVCTTPQSVSQVEVVKHHQETWKQTYSQQDAPSDACKRRDFMQKEQEVYLDVRWETPSTKRDWLNMCCTLFTMLSI